jgi:hypothetical protein
MKFMQCDSLKLHEIIGLIAAIMQILGLAGVLSWSILKRRQSYNALVIAKIAGISFKIAVLFVAATALGRELYTLGFSEIFAILNGRYTGGKLWYDAAPILSLASHLTVSLLLAPLLITLTYFIFTLSFAQTWHRTKFTCCAPLQDCGAVSSSACSALRATRQRSRTKHKRDACFVLCREALRAHLVTQRGFPDCINDTSVTKRQVN